MHMYVAKYSIYNTCIYMYILYICSTFTSNQRKSLLCMPHSNDSQATTEYKSETNVIRKCGGHQVYTAH